jgi:hypothetical protein
MATFYGYNSVEGSKTDEGRTYIAKNIIVQPGLVLHLDAGVAQSYAGSGTTWTDLSGNGNNGTLTNGPTFHSGNGGSIVFDNVDDYITLPGNLGYTTSVSAFAWFKSVGTPTGGFHIIFGGSELEISVPTAGALRTGIETTARYVSNHGAGLTDGAWHNIGFTFAGTTKTSYIDGNNVGTQTTVGTLTSTFSNRTMGRFGSSTQYYLNGNIAQAQIYNRELTAQEVLRNFNATRPRFGV